MLKDIQKGLAAKGIVFQITDDLIVALVELGFDPVFGGRAMRRAVQDKVENIMATALLSRAVRRGDTVAIDPEVWQVKVIATVPLVADETMPSG